MAALDMKDEGFEGINHLSLKIIEDKLLSSSNKDLTKYIYSLYNSEKFSLNLEIIDLMDKKLIEFGIIRMNIIEENKDLSKFFTPFVALMLAYVTAYNTLIKDVIFVDQPGLASLSGLLLIGIVAIVLTRLAENTRKHKEAAIYFRGLLEYAIKEKKQN